MSQINLGKDKEQAQLFSSKLLFPHCISSILTASFFNQCLIRQCPGASSVSDSSPKAEFSTVCIDRKPWLEVVFNSKFSSSINFTTGSTNDGGLCPQTRYVLKWFLESTCSVTESLLVLVHRSCSMVWSGSSGWLFDDSGLERRPQFYNPVLISPSNWKQGRTPFGRNPCEKNRIVILEKL